MSEYIISDEQIEENRRLHGKKLLVMPVIVRCRDCYYADELEGGYWCASGDIPFAHVTPNGFCAWGEKKGSLKWHSMTSD